MNLAICLKIIVIIWIPIVYGADEDSDFDDHCDIDDGDIPTGNGTTNPGPGPEKPGPEKPKNNATNTNATKCRCGVALNDAKPGVRPWTVFIHIPRTKEVHIGTIIASNVIIVNHMTVFDPSGKGNVQTPKVYPHFAGAKAIDISKLKVTQTSSPDSQSYKVVEIDVLPDFLELNPDVASSPVDIAAIIVDFNFADGRGPKWPICLPEAEHIDNVKDVSFILGDGVSNHEMVTLRNSTECDKEARANGREVSWNPLNWERMCASLGRNHWAQMTSNPTVPVTYKDENIYYFYGNNLYYYNDAKPFYQYLPNLKFSKKRLEEILGKRVTKLCEGSDDSSVKPRPNSTETSTPTTVDPTNPECGVNGELPDAKDCGQDPNDSKPGVQPWTVFIHIPRTTEVHIGTIVSSNIIIVKHTTIFDPPGKVDTRTNGVYPFHEGAKVIEMSKIKVTQTSNPGSQSYKVVDIYALPRFMESIPTDTSPPVDMAAIIVDFKFSKDTGPKWPICLPKSFHVGNIEKVSFILGDGISNHKMHPIRRSTYCDGMRKLVWSSTPYNPVNWGSMCVQTFFNYWQQYTSNLQTIPVTYKDGKNYFFYGNTMYTDNAILYYQYIPNIKNTIARLDDIFRKKSNGKCPASMVMGRSLKDEGTVAKEDVKEFKLSRCKCGINPGDNQPGVRPWTVFIHISGLPNVHIGTIVSSNIILVKHVVIFDIQGLSFSKYPYFPGVKPVDMSRLLVTETSSPKSLSYKVVHVDVIPRFFEPHPEDTTPPVDMVAIVVDYNFANGEGTKWPICLPKPGHIGRIKQISFILPDGISNDEKLDIHKSSVCETDSASSKFPPHWEVMCARPMVDYWASFNVSTTMPATYVVDEDKSVTYFFSNAMYYLQKKVPFSTFLPGSKFVVKKLVNLFENRKTEFCPLF